MEILDTTDRLGFVRPSFVLTKVAEDAAVAGLLEDFDGWPRLTSLGWACKNTISPVAFFDAFPGELTERFAVALDSHEPIAVEEWQDATIGGYQFARAFLLGGTTTAPCCLD